MYMIVVPLRFVKICYCYRNPKTNCPSGVNFLQHVIKESLEVFAVER